MKRHIDILRMSVFILGLLFLGNVSATEQDLFGEERDRLKPRCEVVILNGVVAESVGALENFKASKQKESLLERYPLQCNQNVCLGMAAVQKVRAQVENWTLNYLYVTVPLNFDNGRRTVNLWIARQSAKCP